MSKKDLNISEFYRLDIRDRIEKIYEQGLISENDLFSLLSGNHTLNSSSADSMIENVVGVMGLPLGLAMNLVVNGKDYILPMAVEEPSVVAALSSASKLVRKSGGFSAKDGEQLMIGQIQIIDIKDIESCKSALIKKKQDLLNLANSFHPNMVARGGGAKDIEFYTHPLPSRKQRMIVLHLLVDTCDAMGANLVNSMCEGIAPLVESIAGGKAFLRILSNLADRSIFRASCNIPTEFLKNNNSSGEEIRDAIILASEFAEIDPYRAATHNKGVMNGIDPIAIATGNDWRAIEAGAHSYASISGRYTSLTRWTKAKDGSLYGEIEIPLQVGIVSSNVNTNSTVGINLRLLDINSSKELGKVMAAAGLAQNLSAIKALATDGIQKGHMTLHARSVVKAAGASEDNFDEVLDDLVLSGEIKIWKAKEIISNLEDKKSNKINSSLDTDKSLGVGFGKIILLGEHAVVYGKHAIAAPLPMKIKAQIEDYSEGTHILIPRWGVEYKLEQDPTKQYSFEKPASIILNELGLRSKSMKIEVFPELPRGMGLGGSAAMAVAIIRALDNHFDLKLSDEEVNRLAFLSEKVAHGNPSGIDNTLACYGKPLVYRNSDPQFIELLNIKKPIYMIIGFTKKEGLTARTVSKVKTAWKKDPIIYEKIFDQIDSIVLKGIEAIQSEDYEDLGELMNICHGMLNALQVSTPEIEKLIDIARLNGALGAKLTGSGGGGSIIAICENSEIQNKMISSIKKKGFDGIPITVSNEKIND
ncbi:MAG: hydroxymethylglutaryl-CoA reductase, degradative [Pseudomonadota bacterium]|nr:hydroxymethylglutaryl-CoA reductase [Gammaproteobacteria bacterium]MEE2683606.1 hydroxymethylglutaryl-CoA reductase, degradative [Pseudomonadota bacterium]